MIPALEVDVKHHVGDFALSVAFSVESGLAVLFGPSGAGKSLTLSLIAGLLRPDAGRISIAGRVVDDVASGIHVPTRQRRIAMVFQDGLLFPHRSVLDNVALAARQASRRRQRRAIALEWLNRVGAGELAGRKPTTLSGGQRQRVALARALAGDPAFLILDEPLSSLDLVVRIRMRALIHDVVTTTGVPSLLVTHDPEEAAELGDAIIDYDHGSVTGIRRIKPPAGTIKPPMRLVSGEEPD